jgi:hypothetical protein
VPWSALAYRRLTAVFQGNAWNLGWLAFFPFFDGAVQFLRKFYTRSILFYTIMTSGDLPYIA